MKYGYTSNWAEEIRFGSNIEQAIVMFNLKGFLGFMKRKTVTDRELYAIDCLEEMVQMMKNHAEEIKKRG